MAESTFGRRAVNDGKFVARLRDGARITPETLERVSAFLTTQGVEAPVAPRELMRLLRVTAPTARAAPASGEGAPSRNFRFFDNRQKYLLFVNTCSEKEVVARRVDMELAHLHPEPPAVRVFDAGMGDGTVLTRVMREMHRRFPTLPFYFVGKEISLEDVRLSLDKMSDRFYEHPATVVVVTNMYYTEAPWLTPKAVTAATSLVWHEVALTGGTGAEFSEQIAALEPFLAKNWQARHSPKTGNPIYERPVALVIYRDDFRFLLHDVIPRKARARADYDLVIASQPYRARVPVAFKASKVIAPLVRALGPAGGCSASTLTGSDPGLEIVRRIWPDEDPFKTGRHDLLRAVRAELGEGRAPLQLQRLFRQPRRVPLRHAHPAHRDRRQHRHLDAVRRLECRRLRGPDRRRAPGRRAGRAPLPRRHARGAAGARAAVVPGRILRHLAQARLKESCCHACRRRADQP